MITSRVNPKIKFCSQSQPSKRLNNWELIQSIIKNPSSRITKYPNLIEEHRKFMMFDYRKKVDEIKQMKERFSYSAKRQITEKRSRRIYTERSLDMTRREMLSQQKMRKSAQSTRIHTEIVPPSLINTINLLSFQMQEPLKQTEQPKLKEFMTQFQKNQMKRIKARQNITMKKKMDSLKNDSRRILIINSIKLKQKSKSRPHTEKSQK